VVRLRGIARDGGGARVGSWPTGCPICSSMATDPRQPSPQAPGRPARMDGESSQHSPTGRAVVPTTAHEPIEICALAVGARARSESLDSCVS